MSLHITSAALSSQLRLPYVEQGHPDGVPIVLLHGSSDSWRSWELLLPALPDALHAFAITQRGHGDADRPGDGYRPQDQADDLAAFLDAVGLREAIVVGHSAGSFVAQHFALAYPERTRGLVLVSAFRAFHDNPAVVELAEEVARLTDPVDSAFVRAFQESCATRPLPEGFLDQIVTESRKLPARVWKAHFRGLLEAEAPTDTGTITAPTLILWGEEDAFSPRADQDALLGAIPQARLTVYPGTGHCPHWEQVDHVAAALTTFASSVRPHTGVL